MNFNDRWSGPLTQSGLQTGALIVFCALQLLTISCNHALPADEEVACPCEPGWECIGDVCSKECEDICDCPEGFECYTGRCQESESANHSGCAGGGSFSLGVTLHGPPDGYSDLDPFEDCDFVKLCYRLADETKLRDCTTHDFTGPSYDLSGLPEGISLAAVAECYDSDPLSPTPEPNYLVSKGASTTLKGSGGESASVDIYMLRPSSFGPPCAGDSGLFSETGPFSTRWGATTTVLFDGTILIAGGVDDHDSACGDWSDPTCVSKAHSTAEIYDPEDGTFELVGTTGNALMTQKRAFAVAVRLPTEETVIFGGVNANGEPTNTVERYDPVGLSFTAMEPGMEMLYTRARFTATLISSQESGYVLLVGGYGTGEATWEVWNPGVGTVASGPLAESRWNHTATLITSKEDPAVKRDMVVLAGGEGGGEPGATTVRKTLEIFDINANQLDPLPVALCSNTPGSGTGKTMHAAAFVPKRHFLYIAGGFSDSNHAQPVQDICVWHSSQEKWSGEAGTFKLRTGRGALTATALPGNVVLFAGGLIKENGSLQAAENVEIVFEYVKQNTGETVVDIGPGDGFEIPMLHARWDHGAIVGADGKVLFYGGITGGPASFSMVTESELFNPY
jgi:hypothetical protein